MKNGFINIGASLTIVSIITGSIIWVYTTIDGKVEPVEAKATQALNETATLREAIETIKEDNKEIKSDIKLLLQRTK